MEFLSQKIITKKLRKPSKHKYIAFILKLFLIKREYYLICRISSNIIIRAIDIQSLIGTIGGYIGLFLGYSILQIPNIMTVLMKRANKWYSERASRSKNMVDMYPSGNTIEKIDRGTRSHECNEKGMSLNYDDNFIQLPPDTLDQNADGNMKRIMRENLREIMDYIDTSIEQKLYKSKNKSQT